MDPSDGQSLVKLNVGVKNGWDLASDSTSDAGLLAAGWATVTTLQAPWAVATVDFPELDGPVAAH